MHFVVPYRRVDATGDPRCEPVAPDTPGGPGQAAHPRIATAAGGAGILPFCVTDDGQLRFLLGKERFVSNWRGSLRWSAFEGGGKADESTEDNAAREFVEETMGTLGADADLLARDLEGGCALRVTFVLRVADGAAMRGADGAPVTHVPRVTFVKQWPWDASIVDRFRVLRALLMRISSAGHELHEAARQCPRGYPYLREGDVALVLCQGHRQPLPVTLVCGATLSANGTLRLAVETRHQGVQLLFHVNSTAAAHSYVTWLAARSRLAQLLGVAVVDGQPAQHARADAQGATPPVPVRHPALAVQRDGSDVLSGATVDRDHLEKMDIRFWTLGELREVCRRGACPGGEVFRPYFLPVLQTVCDEFQDAAPAPGLVKVEPPMRPLGQREHRSGAAVSNRRWS
jgi:8-oxo-dGTP pyrophosphatase MutT (NUDIX family)